MHVFVIFLCLRSPVEQLAFHDEVYDYTGHFFPRYNCCEGDTKDIQQLLSHLARFSNCMMSWCDMQGERQDDGRIDADGRFH